MSGRMCNCPNCAAPIGYSEVCPYCGTAINWIPIKQATFETEIKDIRKCVAMSMEPLHTWTPEGFIDGILKQQIGQAASEVWKRKTESNDKDITINGVPPHTARHTATVYFATEVEK